MDDDLDLGFAQVCDGCAPKPLGLTPSKIAPTWFIGRLAKLGIATGIPEGEGPTMEHIWVRVTSVKKDNTMHAHVESDPVAIPYKKDDSIEFTLDKIEDFHPKESA